MSKVSDRQKIIIEPTLDDRHLAGYYFMRYYCNNCGSPDGLINHVDVMILKGVKRPKPLICPNCGVEELTP